MLQQSGSGIERVIAQWQPFDETVRLLNWMSDILLAPGQFYGMPGTVSKQNGILLSERCYSPHTKLPHHSHEAPFFCLLLKGNYEESYYIKKMSYAPKSIVFHPSGEVHQTEMGNAGGSVFLIEVGPCWTQLLSNFAREPGTKFAEAGTPLSWLAQQIHRETLDANPCDLLIESFVAEMLGRTVDAEESRFVPSWLAQLIELIHDRYRSTFTIMQMAEEIGLHPFYISRVFRFFNGMSIGDYVNRLRIDRARQMLREARPLRICELASDLGFADQSHFNRTFKKLTGTTPARFRSES